MSVDLRLHRSLDRSTHLVFGRGPSPDEFVGHIVVVAVAPAPVVRMSVGAAYAAAVAVLAPGAAIAIRAEYRSEVERPLVGVARDRAQVAQAYLSSQTERFQQAVSATHSTRTRYQSAALRTAFAGAAFQDAAPAACGLAGVFQASAPMFADAAASWQDAASSHQVLASRFGEAQAASSHVGGRWQDTIRYLRAVTTAAQEAVARAMAIRQHAGPAQQILLRQAGRWQDAWGPRPGRTAAVVPPTPGRYIPPPGNAVDLLFDTLLTRSTHLIFGRDGLPVPAPILVPVLRYYIVINSASLSRVSNNLALPVTGLSLSIDADSSHWTWSASLPLHSLADLEPDVPGELVELEAVVNGLPWRLAVERIRESERFGSASLSIGGRGIAAELSDPTYPVVSHDNVTSAMTAQQLAEAALSINGVPLGWSLDWQAADWLVPAGAWVHSGTPLDSVVRIAAAAGAYVQAAPGSRALRVLPRYPVAPWEWSSATPALVLPASAVIERGTEHVNRAAYNVVYVSGQAGGVLARVKRAGSAGDRAAQMIVDGLITHADAARGRGLEVLGNTGAQQIVSLETGILPASGVIHVGTLMDWTRGAVARRGLVRSLSVTASVPTGTSKDPVKVRQTIGVETHG